MSLLITPVPLATLGREREAHFARLGEAPELFVELLLRHAEAYRLAWRGRGAGYCLMGADGVLVELELDPLVCPVEADAFAGLVERLALRSALCFSFDSSLLARCGERGWRAEPEGVLFRDLVDDPGPAAGDGLVLRPATAGDVESILPHREGVFESDEECRQWVAQGSVSVLEREGVFLGVGVLTRVWPTRPEHDVGVMIHPDHRGHGHATRVLRMLKRRCLDAGLRPTAGCAVDNVPSLRALRRAGFESRHSLMRLERPAR